MVEYSNREINTQLNELRNEWSIWFSSFIGNMRNTSDLELIGIKTLVDRCDEQLQILQILEDRTRRNIRAYYNSSNREWDDQGGNFRTDDEGDLEMFTGIIEQIRIARPLITRDKQILLDIYVSYDNRKLPILELLDAELNPMSYNSNGIEDMIDIRRAGIDHTTINFRDLIERLDKNMKNNPQGGGGKKRKTKRKKSRKRKSRKSKSRKSKSRKIHNRK